MWLPPIKMSPIKRQLSEHQLHVQKTSFCTRQQQQHQNNNTWYSLQSLYGVRYTDLHNSSDSQVVLKICDVWRFSFFLFLFYGSLVTCYDKDLVKVNVILFKTVKKGVLNLYWILYPSCVYNCKIQQIPDLLTTRPAF